MKERRREIRKYGDTIEKKRNKANECEGIKRKKSREGDMNKYEANFEKEKKIRDKKME